MKIVSVAGAKGGTGKTATCHNLASVLARRLKVLLIDTDPQSSLTHSVMSDKPRGATLADVYRGAQIREAIHQGGPLDIIPADIELASVELELVGKIGRENVLRRALANVKDYDLCIIDCPPSLSLLSINALTASRGVLIPTGPTSQDLRGLAQFMDTIKQVQTELNQALEVIGILPTFYDPRLTHHKQALEAMRAAGLPVMKIQIRRSVRIAEAAGLSQSLAEYAPDHPQNESYLKLGKVVEQWLRSKP